VSARHALARRDALSRSFGRFIGRNGARTAGFVRRVDGANGLSTSPLAGLAPPLGVLGLSSIAQRRNATESVSTDRHATIITTTAVSVCAAPNGLIAAWRSMSCSCCDTSSTRCATSAADDFSTAECMVGA
jgi:hypothetical protein